MAVLNEIKIKKEQDTARIFIDEVEVRGIKSYEIVEYSDPQGKIKQQLTLVITKFKDLSVF